jgi:prepilin-type processing-associated H-X9-DG protein
MPVFMKFDGVDGDVSASRGETTLGDISIAKQLDEHPAGLNMLFGDGSVRDSGVNPPSWGLDRVDMSADAGPFFAYGDGFLGGVDAPAASPGLIRLEIIYAPHGEQDVGGLVVEVAGIEAKGPHMLMTAGFMF